MVSYLVPRNRIFSKYTLRHIPIKSNNTSPNQNSGRWPKWSTFRRNISSNNHDQRVENIVQQQNNKIKSHKDDTNGKYQSSNHGSNSSRNKWFSWPGLLFRWAPMGVCILALEWQYHHYECDKDKLPRTASNFQSTVYCSLPLRLISRCWGWLADVYVPVNLRPYVFGFYSKTFNVNLEEAAVPDFKYYRSIADFFTRSLKDGARVIDEKCDLVSPSDGKVLHIGTVNKSLVEQVKGITYKIDSFLGPNTWTTPNDSKEDWFENEIKCNKTDDSVLYQCIIYLAPGDYHRFHSAAHWEPNLRRHFPGQLLSVNPKIAKWFPGLFCVNERVVYVGKWQHGFFSYTAVGATNVGSVQIYIDEKLKTNQWMGMKSINKAQYDDLTISNKNFEKGELIGQFNMGSTIVLLFEASKNFKFKVEPGQKVSVGEPLGEFL